jgi:chromosome partitioning protein
MPGGSDVLTHARAAVMTGVRPHGSGARIAVANLKGGTGKTTTTAVHLACGLAEAGRTLLIDADPQRSALGRSERAGGFRAAVVGLPVRDLHRRVEELARGFAHVVIDTSPGEHAIVRAALLAVDQLVVPLAPTPIDLDRLAVTVDLAAEVDALRPLELRLLLTRVRRGPRSAREVRAALEDLGVPVLENEIPPLEAVGLAFGVAPAPERGATRRSSASSPLAAGRGPHEHPGRRPSRPDARGGRRGQRPPGSTGACRAGAR